MSWKSYRLSSAPSEFAIALEHFNNGNLQEALEGFEAAAKTHPNNYQTLQMRGETKRLLGDIVGALIDFNASDSLCPKDPFTLTSRAATKLCIGDYEGALEDFSLSDSLAANAPMNICGRGIVHRLLGDKEKSIIDLQLANSLLPNDAYILSNLAETQRLMGDLTSAITNLNAAHKIAPFDPFTLTCRGIVKRRLGDLVGSIEDFDKSDSLSPNDPYTIKNRGLTWQLLGELDQSLKDFDTANIVESDDIFTILNRGVTKKLLGDYLGALQDFTHAENLNPESKYIQEQRDEVKQLLENATQPNVNSQLSNLGGMSGDVDGLSFDPVSVEAFDELINDLNTTENTLKPKIPASKIEISQSTIYITENVTKGNAFNIGNYGIAFHGTWKDRSILLKSFPSTPNTFIEELLSRKLSHRNIVRYLGMFDFENITYLVLDFSIESSPLDAFLELNENSVSETDLIHIALQISQGMDYLHEHNLIHYQLSARNVFIRKNTQVPELGTYLIKIHDYGLHRASKSQQHLMTSIDIEENDIRWTAPEVLTRRKYSRQSDIWSFGVTCWEIFSFAMIPYWEKGNNDHVREFVGKGGKLEKPFACPHQVWKVMIQCWELPHQRPTFQHLSTELQHLCSTLK